MNKVDYKSLHLQFHLFPSFMSVRPPVIDPYL